VNRSKPSTKGNLYDAHRKFTDPLK